MFGYLTLLAVFALTALPLLAVLPSSPSMLDDEHPQRPALIPWRISLTVTIARKEHTPS